MKVNDVWIKQEAITNKLTLTTQGQAGAFKLNSDVLSKLAQEDLPRAIELLSTLQVNGKVSSQTLGKLFNKMDIYGRNTISKVA